MCWRWNQDGVRDLEQNGARTLGFPDVSRLCDCSEDAESASVQTQPSHFLPESGAGNAEQGGCFRDLAMGLEDCLLDMPAFGAFARLGETCDTFI